MPEDPLELMGVLVSDTRLSARLSPEAFHRLVSRTPELPASVFDRMAPWGAAVLSASSSALQHGGPRGMDEEVVERGAQHGATRLYVETVEEQAALLASFNDQFLEGLEQVPDLGAEAARFSELDRLCREGVMPDSGELLDAADPFTDALLHRRNRAWMPKLLPELAQGGAFVAVGAAHMLGKQGLIELLEAEGYTITQRSAKRRITPPGAYEPPAPPTPYEPVKASEIARHLAGVVDAGCAPTAMLVQCFFDSEPQCRDTLTADLALCAGQHPEWPSSGLIDARIITEVSNCVAAGAVIEGVSRPLRPAPACQMIGALMQAKGGRSP